MQHRLQRLVQLLGNTLTTLGAVLLALWAVRGQRPALARCSEQLGRVGR